MPDLVLSRELKSLHEELATAQRQRPAPSADRPAESGTVTGTAAGAAATAAANGRPEESATAQETHSQLQDLIKEITDFVDEAEENISAHPAMSIVGAILLGIVIGSLLARR
ncbi:MAG: hypothetical protein Q8M26_03525 [Pseudolabrys sp.]|nr:hypothetical protein [Pseudolabrys sp.]